MSISLDRLYHYIENIAEHLRQDHVVIYRFSPHGSKKQEDLGVLKFYSVEQSISSPTIICYDQEPLNFNLYESDDGRIPETQLADICSPYAAKEDKLRQLFNQITIKRYNLRHYPLNIYDHAILVHSELRSIDVEKYSNNNFIPVYYWSHAILALDWFRFARHVEQKKQITHTFLIYNRAWSGTREYRLKFLESLVKLDLQAQCKTNINTIEPELGIHYNSYQFDNPIWKPNIVLENYFSTSSPPSYYSADFDLTDYNSTNIEVVLETLFDDNRLHLTEKSLRPVACGQPFILAATHNSLEYLRSYGFKTFGHIWDEQYDREENPECRLLAIASLMRTIADWDPATRQTKLAQAREIAAYNRQHFFSNEFEQLLEKELTTNLAAGLSAIETKNTGHVFINRRKTLYWNPEMRQSMIKDKKDRYYSRYQIAQWLKLARQYKLSKVSSKINF
jgi:hypothetical protein